MRRIVIAIIAIVASFHAGFAHADRSLADARRSAKTTVPLRGTLYRVDYQGHTCYLFGTVHVGQAAFYPLEPQVTHALQQADRLVIEVDIRNTAAFQQAILQYGLYPGSQTIEQHLLPVELARLKATVESSGISFQNVVRMRPWMIANVLIVQAMAQQGFPVEQGLELYFLSEAEKQHKRVSELETAAYQLGLFDQLNEQQQQDYLRETVHNLADGSEIKKGMALLQAWQGADSLAMEVAMNEMLQDGSPTSRFIQRVLLEQRNPGMADKIATWTRSDRRIFVAVGALHLLGDKGIPKLLQQRGYAVQKLY
jgi:uncharacterized protein YbaP (TraB family)